MKILSRLYCKLALTMLALFFIVGVVIIYITAQTSERYSLEITQYMSRDVALHAAEDMAFFKNGEVNEPALKDLAHHVMLINPMVEVYLLDTNGNVLSHALPYDTVLLDKINMAPLHAFIKGQQALPILGDNPRSTESKKVFSVSPIKEDGEIKAYLYTILNGSAYDKIRDSLSTSHNLQVSTAIIIACLLLAVVAGAFIFALLTKRLNHLTQSVKHYRETNLNEVIPTLKNHESHDEIDSLNLAFRNMSDRIDQQFVELQAIDNSRRELIANVSHDLRTPLTSMQGYLETILVKAKDIDQQQQEEYIQIAYKHSQRLNSLISELFELAKLESASMEPSWENFPLMELVQDLIQDFSLQMNQQQVSISVQCKEPGLMVYADIALIHRVLDNLVQNALRHTGEGGDIVLKVHSDSNKVCIEVIDSGEGIASHDIPLLFDRFYQRDSNRARGGNGLGLAIVKKILDLHRSTVTVRSELNRGTVFSFWLSQAV